MGTTVAIHQPNYLPWVGYFHKIARSNVFVFLDNVEFSGSSWIHRNKIKTPQGWQWLTVPTKGSDSELIQDVRVDTSQPYRRKHRNSLKYNYSNAPYFDENEEILSVYDEEWEFLAELNVTLIDMLVDALELNGEFVFASDLTVSGKKNDLLIDICSELGATEYLSGTGARGYMDEDQFSAAGVTVTYQDIDHPEYEQLHDNFVPKLSFVDMLFNLGRVDCRDILLEL